MKGQYKKFGKIFLNTLFSTAILAGLSVAAVQAEPIPDYETRLKLLEDTVYKQNQSTAKVANLLKGLTFSGQMTMIYQTSGLDLQRGDLVDSSGTARTDYPDFAHKQGTGSFSTDLFIEKEFDDNGYFMFNLEFANGSGVDAPLQGGAMVNNDIMEDMDNHNQPYIARAYYERTIPLNENYALIFDIGKFGVPDFFDDGERVADQTTQFLNQAVCNTGAFDYVQDLQGHGYTYGARAALETPFTIISGAFMSSDSYLDNINDKYSLIGAIGFKHEKIGFSSNIYIFKNYGEYGKFNGDGTFTSKDASSINTANNADDLDKGGFGANINQAIPSLGVNLFAKYGCQDDDRDVRHYQDMDESTMFGFDVSGQNWKRHDDIFGVAYEIGKLTGPHRKAHERGYTSFFDRPGIGTGNYADEHVLEVYYKISTSDSTSLSLDYQYINNFYYSKQIGSVDFWGVRYNVVF